MTGDIATDEMKVTDNVALDLPMLQGDATLDETSWNVGDFPTGEMSTTVDLRSDLTGVEMMVKADVTLDEANGTAGDFLTG